MFVVFLTQSIYAETFFGLFRDLNTMGIEGPGNLGPGNLEEKVYFSKFVGEIGN